MAKGKDSVVKAESLPERQGLGTPAWTISCGRYERGYPGKNGFCGHPFPGMDHGGIMAETILLTGGTGFLGTELASHLAADPDVTVYALVRADADAHAHQRLRAAWQHDRKLAGAVGQRIQPLRGDFTHPSHMILPRKPLFFK